MKNVLRLIGAGALATGLMLAQSTSTETTSTPRGAHRDGMVDRMSRMLNLSSDQAAVLKQSMTASRQAMRPVEQQLRTDREALMTAAKANPQGDLSAQSSAVARDMAQLIAAHAQAYAQFYNTLTPAQKQVMDNLPGRAGLEGGFGGGHGGFDR